MMMSNNRVFQGQLAPEWATAVTKWRGAWFWEESIEQKLGDRFCRCGVDYEKYTRTYASSTVTGYDAAYALPPLTAEDDPLPPAPESARYIGLNSMVRSQLDLWPHADTLRMKVGYGELDGSDKLVVLDPDSALQLAHDLRRMAMDIKRKQKEVD